MTCQNHLRKNPSDKSSQIEETQEGKFIYKGPEGATIFGSAFNKPSSVFDSVSIDLKAITATLRRGQDFSETLSSERIQGVPQAVLSSPNILPKFLEDTYVTVSHGGAGIKVHVHPRLRGGKPPKKPSSPNNHNNRKAGNPNDDKFPALVSSSSPNQEAGLTYQYANQERMNNSSQGMLQRPAISYSALIPTYSMSSPAAQSSATEETEPKQSPILKTPYDALLTKVADHIESMPNPELAERVKSFLLSYTGEKGRLPDFDEGFPSVYLKTHRFPEETRIIISELGLLFKSQISSLSNKNELINRTREFTQIIQEIIQRVSIRKDHVWPKLSQLIKLPEVQELSNQDQQEVLKLIDTENADKVNDGIIALLENHGVDTNALDKRIKDENSKLNLYTMGSQAISCKPKKKTFLESVRSDQEADIKRKLLRFNSDVVGLVKSVSCNQYGEVILVLEKDHSKPFEIKLDAESRAYKITESKPSFTSLLSRGVNSPSGASYTLTFGLNSESSLLREIFKNRKEVFPTEKSIKFYDHRNYCVYILEMNKKGGLDVIENNWGPNKIIDTIPKNEIDNTISCHVKTTECLSNNADETEKLFSLSPEKTGIEELKQDAEKEVIQEMNHFSDLLMKDEETLDALITSLVENKLNGVDISLANSDLENQFKKVQCIYSEKLKEKREPKEILKEAILDANYANLTNPDRKNISQSRQVAKIMEMLELSETYREKIQGQPGILFVGPTGAGKSLTIGRILGHDVVEGKNSLGQKIYRLENPTENTPQLGHAIATSETLFTQGYKKHVSQEVGDLLMLDTAGSSETRGGTYEICGHLSLDRAIQSLKELKAIVFVLPLDYFTISRGSLIMDFFRKESDRFPTAFDVNLTGIHEDIDNVHILITKALNSEESVLKKLSSGELINSYLQELESEEKKLQQEADVDSDTIDELKKKIKIWKAINYIFDRGRFDKMIPKDLSLPDTLLDKYAKAGKPSFNKKEYVSGMKDNSTLLKKYADSLTSYSNTWRTEILDQYEEHVKEIEKSKNEISRLEQEVNRVKEDGESEQRHLIEEEENVQSQIIKMQNSKGGLQGLNEEETAKFEEELEELHHKLNKKPEEFERTRKKFWEDFYDRVTARTEGVIRSLDYTGKILLAKGVAKFSEIMVKKLSEGTYAVPLVRIPEGGKWGETIPLYHVSSEAKKAALDNVTDIPDEEYKNKREVVTNSYTGIMEHHRAYHRKYPLLPIQKEFQQQFCKEIENNNFGPLTTVVVRGSNMKVVARNAKPDSSGVVYSFQTNWSRNMEKYPSIEVDHIIPKKDLYSGNELPRLSNQIERAKKEVEETEERKFQEEKALILIDHQLSQIWKDFVTSINDEKDQIKRVQEMTIAKLLNNAIKQREMIHQKQIKSSNDLKNSVSAKNEMLKNEKTNLANLEKAKRNLSLIIQTKIENVKLLRKFATLTIQNNTNMNMNDPMVNKGVLEQACRSFLSAYSEEKIQKIFKQCEEDLCLTQ